MSDPQQPPYAPQPENAGPPYAQPAGYPATIGFSTPGYGAAPVASSTLGRTAFIVALITAALGVFFTLSTPVLITGMDGDHAIWHVLSTARAIVGLALGALALILGIIAARRGAQPVLAGIAIGVGGIEVLGLFASFFVNLVYTVI